MVEVFFNLRQEVHVLTLLVLTGMSVCHFVSVHDLEKMKQCIPSKFEEYSGNAPRKKLLNFGSILLATINIVMIYML